MYMSTSGERPLQPITSQVRLERQNNQYNTANNSQAYRITGNFHTVQTFAATTKIKTGKLLTAQLLPSYACACRENKIS